MSSADVFAVLGCKRDVVEVNGSELEVHEVSAAGRLMLKEAYAEREDSDSGDGDAWARTVRLAALWVKYGVSDLEKLDVEEIMQRVPGSTLIKVSNRIVELSNATEAEAEKN